MPHIRAIFFLLISTLLAALAGGCSFSPAADDSTSPGFSHLYHHCFELKQDVFVIHYTNIFGQDTDGYAFSLKPPAENDPCSDMPKSVDEYKSKPREYWRKSGGEESSIEAVMAKGTHLRFDLLVAVTRDQGLQALATVIDGPYRDKLVYIDDFVVSPLKPPEKLDYWSANPTYLSPCSDEKP